MRSETVFGSFTYTHWTSCGWRRCSCLNPPSVRQSNTGSPKTRTMDTTRGSKEMVILAGNSHPELANLIAR
ncbi:hypothetical protein E2C01_002721 [Portunus trituberculatus]|uniref:Ribose-phosphate pyrophosphokinase N-terminal domain-containing protein n=1 Tax=Portunus trituberculatus TaxID=210409 RepID=A0A5B7CRH6_PORTR|nr:hypothetical protein [Portunus trituberculatus]